MSSFREKTSFYKVYHIRLKGSRNTSQGYIGITRRTLPYRLGQHFNSTRPVGDILRSLGRDAIEIVQLALLPKEKALEMEFNLRPSRFMGWNIQAGGNGSTVCCPSCGKHLPKRRTGQYCQSCRDSRFNPGHKPFNYGKGERYQITDPQGNTYAPEAFTVFCQQNNLTPQNLRKVAEGSRKHHKGWTAVRLKD
jgi:hypothetical protein